MFGLSIRKTLAQAVGNACQNNKNVYKESVKKSFGALSEEENDESKMTRLMMQVREEYLTKVFDDVVKAMSISNPKIEQRVRLAIMSPSICGLEDRNIDDGVMAGTVYAICYWAITNKQAKSGDCIALNHYQNDIMQSALQELQQEAK